MKNKRSKPIFFDILYSVIKQEKNRENLLFSEETNVDFGYVKGFPQLFTSKETVKWVAREENKNAKNELYIPVKILVSITLEEKLS